MRYLQTLTEIAKEKTNTIVFPLPMDLIEPLLGCGSLRGRRPGDRDPRKGLRQTAGRSLAASQKASSCVRSLEADPVAASVA